MPCNFENYFSFVWCIWQANSNYCIWWSISKLSHFKNGILPDYALIFMEIPSIFNFQWKTILYVQEFLDTILDTIGYAYVIHFELLSMGCWFSKLSKNKFETHFDYVFYKKYRLLKLDIKLNLIFCSIYKIIVIRSAHIA